MSTACEVPNCGQVARFEVRLGAEAERTELCHRHADRAVDCGGKQLRRLAAAS